MPIHDQGYRRFEGVRRPRPRTWWVIARAGIVAQLHARWFKALLLVAWLPFLVRAVQMYVAVNVPTASFLAPTPDTFRIFLEQQRPFVFFVTVTVGAGLVANDRRANALPIYLSKPLTSVDYVAGKLVTLVVFLLAVTWVPSLMLLLLQVLLAGDAVFLRANLFLVPAVTLASALDVLVSSCIMLALSSLTTSSRLVGLMYAGSIFFTAGVSSALRSITGSPTWAWLSPSEVLDVMAGALFRSAQAPPIPVLVASLIVVALVGLSLQVVVRRVRGVEVVA